MIPGILTTQLSLAKFSQLNDETVLSIAHYCSELRTLKIPWSPICMSISIQLMNSFSSSPSDPRIQCSLRECNVNVVDEFAPFVVLWDIRTRFQRKHWKILKTQIIGSELDTSYKFVCAMGHTTHRTRAAVSRGPERDQFRFVRVLAHVRRRQPPAATH